jgi:hypothetical protein
MLKYFMRYRPGWWVLHIIMIGFTMYLGRIAEFTF